MPGIRRRSAGERVGRVRRLGNRRGVETPLIGKRRGSTHAHAERRTGVRRHDAILRLRGDGGQTGRKVLALTASGRRFRAPVRRIAAAGQAVHSLQGIARAIASARPRGLIGVEDFVDDDPVGNPGNIRRDGSFQSNAIRVVRQLAEVRAEDALRRIRNAVALLEGGELKGVGGRIEIHQQDALRGIKNHQWREGEFHSTTHTPGQRAEDICHVDAPERGGARDLDEFFHRIVREIRSHKNVLRTVHDLANHGAMRRRRVRRAASLLVEAVPELPAIRITSQRPVHFLRLETHRVHDAILGIARQEAEEHVVATAAQGEAGVRRIMEAGVLIEAHEAARRNRRAGRNLPLHQVRVAAAVITQIPACAERDVHVSRIVELNPIVQLWRVRPDFIDHNARNRSRVRAPR